MSPSFDLTDAYRVTLGVVGEPGNRTFYLQARTESQTVSLKMEKAQVATLCDYLEQLLDGRDLTGSEPNLVFESPDNHDWIVGNMSMGFDDNDERVVLLVEELVLADPSAESATPEAREDASVPQGALARLALTPRHAQALARLGTELVNAGRLPCPWCGHPIDPAGHSCPRTNGHHRP